MVARGGACREPKEVIWLFFPGGGARRCSLTVLERRNQWQSSHKPTPLILPRQVRRQRLAVCLVARGLNVMEFGDERLVKALMKPSRK